MTPIKPLTPKFPALLHGGDYNPEQWLDMPEILEKDIELMKKANVNCATLGVFSWVSLEPQDGIYTFEWLDSIIDNLYKNGIYVVLATPTGAKPMWMTRKYPEILRVQEDRVRNLQGGRHNHCFTSPVYRRKTKEINTRLAQRYADHPAVILWHISNEIQGECHCELCQEAFRGWLKEKYSTLDALNHAWWMRFWGHTYTDWSEIESPSSRGHEALHGLNADWKRFCTAQEVDFCKAEIETVKAVNPNIPCTTNMMDFWGGTNYFKFKDILDVISWDCYPQWNNNNGDDVDNGVYCACYHDMMRSMKKKPFLLMENTPGTANWCPVSKQKHPSLHKLASLQAVAHGSNSVQYFQWRQSRGGPEKMHSAVISHRGTADDRIFRNVTEVGAALQKIQTVYNTNIEAKVCLIYDIENSHAIADAKGPRNLGPGYRDTFNKHYKAFFEQGISCDIVDMEGDLDGYTLVVAPMLYMYRAGIAEKLERFVASGGTLITTYFSGVVDENDLCFLGDAPAQGISDVTGIYVEVLDALYDHEENSLVCTENSYGLKACYKVNRFCEISHLKTAKVLAEFGGDYYKGSPALTVNEYKKGRAFYMAGEGEYSFLKDFYAALCKEIHVEKNLDTELPYGVTVDRRIGEDGEIYFIQNFLEKEAALVLPFPLKEIVEDENLSGEIILPPYGVKVCVRA